MSSQLSTRYAWKAFHGLKAIRLTPTVNELPPSIKHTITKDDTLIPVFEHAITLRIANNGASFTSKHTDEIKVDLSRESATQSVLKEKQQRESQLLSALLETKGAKHWDSNFKQLLDEVQKSENPVETFEKMAQTTDPFLKHTIKNLLQTFSQQSEDAEQSTVDLVNEALESQKQLLSNASKATKISSVLDSMLVKRLDPAFIVEEEQQTYRDFIDRLKSADPFERVDVEFNALNPVEAIMEVSKLFHKFGENADNSEADEAEAMRRFTSIERDFSLHFESLASQKESAKLSPIAARYKAITQSLRNPNSTKTLDPREEELLRQYYTRDVKKLPNTAFLSFSEILNYSQINRLIASETKTDRYATYKKVKEILRKQYEEYLSYKAPLTELNRQFVEKQQEYLSKEGGQIAKLDFERDGVLDQLLAADFMDYPTDPIVERLAQIQRDISHLRIAAAEAAAPNNETVKAIATILKKLADFEFKQRQDVGSKQIKRYSNPHQYTPYLQQFAAVDIPALIKREETLVAQLTNEINSLLTADRFSSLTKAIQELIRGVDTSLTLEREQLVKNVQTKNALNDLYVLFQQYGQKHAEAQLKYVQQERAKQQSNSNKDQEAISKAVNSLGDLIQKTIVQKQSIHKGLLDDNVMAKAMEIVQAHPQLLNNIRQLIAPKKYFSEEIQAEKTGRVAYPCKVVKKVTVSAMPEGFRRKGDRKVVLTSKVQDLGLTAEQIERLKVIAGPKFNKTSGQIRIVVRMFETPEEGEVYARQYFHELIEAAKNPDLALETPAVPQIVDPFDALKSVYSAFDEEATQSAEALDKWIMYKETGKKAVGADLTYGEGIREVVWADHSTKSLRDEYGYNIADEEDDEEFELSEDESDQE